MGSTKDKAVTIPHGLPPAPVPLGAVSAAGLNQRAGPRRTAATGFTYWLRRRVPSCLAALHPTPRPTATLISCHALGCQLARYLTCLDQTPQEPRGILAVYNVVVPFQRRRRQSNRHFLSCHLFGVNFILCPLLGCTSWGHHIERRLGPRPRPTLQCRQLPVDAPRRS